MNSQVCKGEEETDSAVGDKRNEWCPPSHTPAGRFYLVQHFPAAVWEQTQSLGALVGSLASGAASGAANKAFVKSSPVCLQQVSATAWFFPNAINQNE